jgi:thiamine biosynthesis lipoprotein ApbE
MTLTTTTGSELRFRAMGCDVHVLVVGGRPGLLQAARGRVEELEQRWSRFRATSEISRLNALAGSSVRLSPLTIGLVERALEGARVTGGRYDPTVLGDLLRAGYDRSFERLSDGSGHGTSPLRQGWDRVLVDSARSRVTRSEIMPTRLAANGHQPVVSSSSTRAWSPWTATERTRPMSTTEMPFS